jgi:hypothetical protein
MMPAWMRVHHLSPLAWTIALAVAFPWPGASRAQAPDRSASSPADYAAYHSATDPDSASDDLTRLAGQVAEAVEEPGPAPTFNPTTPPRIVLGPLEVIHKSLFGPASTEDWHPLSLATFFSEGWDEPFVRSPEGTNEAPKQIWVGAASGVFARLYTLNFFYTNGLTANRGLLLTALPFSPVKPKTDGNQYTAYSTIIMPLNQRMDILFVAPFIESNKTSPTGPYVGNFGDLGVQARFRLIEQRNFSMIAFVGERMPTGKTVNGSDVNFVTPSAEFWWNFAPKWVLRGGTGINIDTGRLSATSVYFNNLAIGRYLTTKDARLFKELVVHTSVSTLSDVTGRAGHISDIYLMPGFRFGLGEGQKWYVMGGVQVPVSGPQSYVWQPNFALVKNY